MATPRKPKPKPPKVKPIPRQGTGIKIARVRCEQMFGYWLENDRNTLLTSEQFKVSRKALARIRDTKVDGKDWNDRADAIEKRIRARIDTQIVAKEVSNVKIVSALVKKVAAELLQKGSKVKPTYRDLVVLMQYEDELGGNLPPTNPDGGDDYGDFEGIDKNTLKRNLAAIFSDRSED